MRVEAYLMFDGRCEEALEFYRQQIGAEITALLRFKDNPEPPNPEMGPPSPPDKVMHSCFRVGDTTIMASDGNCRSQPKFDGFCLTISVPEVSEAQRLFEALSAGGQVQMPLTKTFFSPSFGMVADKFGVCWMILTCVPQ